MLKFLYFSLVFCGACYALNDFEILDQWQNFQVEHGKSYKSPIEASRRLQIFKDNLEEIERHNALYEKGEVTWSMGINEFTDWTDEEFNDYVNSVPEEDDSNFLPFTLNRNVSYPDSIDWREKGVVATPLRQATCGCCWAFAAVGALEGHVAIRDGSLTQYSIQNLVDCCKLPKYKAKGCSGGTATAGFTYIKDNGIRKRKNYPDYDAKDNWPCRQSDFDLKIKGMVKVDTNEISILQAVGDAGPVAAGIYSLPNLKQYKEGVYFDPDCNSGSVNHGVVLVGYGSEGGVDYWIVKNSWGDKWGQGGFFKLVRGSNACLVNTQVRYPVV